MNDKIDNLLLEEIWSARKEIVNECGNDIDTIYHKFHSKQLEHPSEYFSGKPVYIQSLKAA